MKRLLPPSRTRPVADATYFDRVMRLHFLKVNPAPREKRSNFAGQAIGYASVIFLLLVALSIFGDI